MEMIVFEIRGDYAYFRIPEGTRSSYSFPFPPRTAVFGLIASILGKEENKYWDSSSNFSFMKIGVEIVNTPYILPMKMNYWRSRKTISVGSNKLGLKFILPSDVGGKEGRGFTTQVKLGYMKDVCYRIYLKISDPELFSEIDQRLGHKKYYQPPYLGHANLLAEILYLGKFEADEIDEGNFHSIIYNKSISIKSLETLSIGASGFTLYSGVPVKYNIELVSTTTIDFWKNIPSEYGTVFIPEPNSSLHLSLKPGFGFKLKINGEMKHISVY